MKYISTRSKQESFTLSQALDFGLAPDGGLFVPDTLPKFRIEDFLTLNNFSEFATRVLEPFFSGDALATELGPICESAFQFPIVLKELSEHTSVLELFHGPTAAFKDFGARFLAECLSRTTTEERTILVATSGDTGGAVASAFHGRKGFKVVILFPKNGVSARQRQQLTCFGDNVHAFAVDGSFDVCQKLVKAALADSALKQKMKLSSANSINIGRLLPQMTYYAWSSIQYLRKHGSATSFIIPTGNAGNAFAAILAKLSGFPIRRIGLVTNANAVIPNYFKTKTFRAETSLKTLANAMDVGNPSNMERILYFEAMGFNLAENCFSESVNDSEISKTIQAGPLHYQEIWCPHTATAVFVRNQKEATEDYTIVSTAHPAKFETIVEPLIGHKIKIPQSLESLLTLPTQENELTGEETEFFSALKGVQG